ncbi:MAG: ABC transporter ATP-binding protein [Candidatus Omnitrophica bacterium]|jgi:ABC-2 type transport system ATP-binding protein|nr:ABC transporter ATP-binding protein [Candidatus Omnitrophota bacterium]
MPDILSVKSLSKSYGKITAVDGISFSVKQNEIVGLLGPNGAGKTTTIHMLLGVLEPDIGTIHIDGLNLKTDRSHAIACTNFTAVYTPLPGNLTVRQNLSIFARIYGIKDINGCVDKAIKQFGLDKFGNKKCGLLSSGEQTRVGLAKAVLNNPKLLLLDEPTASLDPASANEIRGKIRELTAFGKSGMLWASHNMYEVEDMCDRVLFLSHGKILLEGNPKELPSRHGQKTLEDLFIKVAREPLTLKNS